MNLVVALLSRQQSRAWVQNLLQMAYKRGSEEVTACEGFFVSGSFIGIKDLNEKKLLVQKTF